MEKTTQLKERIYNINKDKKEEMKIRDDYANLKTEICDELHNWSLKKSVSGFAKSYYIPAIKGASVYGFKAYKNAKVNEKMAQSIEEANYRLKKYISYNKLIELLRDPK